MTSWQGAGKGGVPPKFWALGKLLEHFLLVVEFSSEMQICSWKKTFWENLGAKWTLGAPAVSSVGKLQLCPRPLFFKPRRRWLFCYLLRPADCPACDAYTHCRFNWRLESETAVYEVKAVSPKRVNFQRRIGFLLPRAIALTRRHAHCDIFLSAKCKL